MHSYLARVIFKVAKEYCGLFVNHIRLYVNTNNA